MLASRFSSHPILLHVSGLMLLACAATACGVPSDTPSPDADHGEPGPADAERPPLPAEAVTPIEILLLGTFHFEDPGLDSYKPEHRLDVLSERRQAEMGEVLDRLAGFEPDFIGVEVRASQQARLDERYAAFRADTTAPASADEIVQLGYRLAARLGHDRLYAIDAAGRSYFPDMTEEQWIQREESLMQGIDPSRIEAELAWDARFERMYKFFDELKTRRTLREVLLASNEERILLAHHGAYLIGGFKLGRGDDYFGADAKTAWFNRNLRIFQNIQRIPQSPGDRILVVIGAGHVPILRHCIQASPEYALVEARDVLGDR